MIDYSLYLCTNSDINKYFPIEKCVELAILGGVTFVQVREKNKSFEEFLEISKRIKKVTDKYNIPLIINDNIDVAVQLKADGVHLGQKDIECSEARKILGNNKIVGISATTLDEAKKAIDDGATYLGVGAIFPTKTKKDAEYVSLNELEKIINYSNIPIVVIGGINRKTIPMLRDYDISGFAMISSILDNKDITEKSMELKRLINKNGKEI